MNENPAALDPHEAGQRRIRTRSAMAAGVIALLSLLAVIVLATRSPNGDVPAEERVAAAATSDERAAPSATPAPPAPVPGRPPVTPAIRTTPTPVVATSVVSKWPLVLGAALCFGALFLGTLKLTTDRTPRARGMARPHRSGLSGMALRAEAMTDNVLQRGGQRSIIGDGLEQAGLDIRPGEFIVTVLTAALVAGLVGWAMVAFLFGVLLAFSTLVLSKVVVSLLAGRRRKQFVDQLAETLQLLTGSLRAGNGLTQALDTVGRESESPTSEEFRRVLVETRLGRDLSGALQAVAERMRSQDMLWVVQAIDINREIGGNLAEILDTITGTIRDRSRLRRQVSALTAEGRLSALVVMILPFVLSAVMAVINPEYLSPLYSTLTGVLLLGVGGAALLVGGLWLRKLVTPVF